MMNQQPDKIFREKLEPNQRSAPASAWDRIEAGLDEKQKSAWPWLRVAAAILFLAVAAWIIWPSNANVNPKDQISRKDEVQPEKAPSPSKEKLPTTQEQPATTIAPAEKKPQQHVAPEKIEQTIPKKKEADKSTPITPATTHMEIQMAEVDRNHESAPSNIEQNDATAKQTIAMTNVEDEQNIKIVYTANAAEKYLKKPVSDEATSDEKKTSRLQRLLDKAEDLTTNQDPIGEFRQAKNEILALNFRSEKDRGQNK